MGQTDFDIEHGRRDAASRRGSRPPAAQPTKPGSARTRVNWIGFDSTALHFSDLPPVSVKNAVLEVRNRTLLCDSSRRHDVEFEHARRGASSSTASVFAKAQALCAAIFTGRSCGAAPWIVGDCECLVEKMGPDRIAQAMPGLRRNRAQHAAFGERARQHMRDEAGIAAVAVSDEMLYAAARDSKAVT